MLFLEMPQSRGSKPNKRRRLLRNELRNERAFETSRFALPACQLLELLLYIRVCLGSVGTSTRVTHCLPSGEEGEEAGDCNGEGPASVRNR